MYLDKFVRKLEKSEKSGKLDFATHVQDFAFELSDLIFGHLRNFLLGKGDEYKKAFYDDAERILRNAHIVAMPEIDHRYCFRSSVGRGIAICRIVSDTLATMLRAYNSRGDKVFLKHEFVDSAMRCDNPSMKGFMAEQIVLSSINMDGFLFLNKYRDLGQNVSKMSYTWSEEAVLLLETGKCYHYIPAVHNYKHIDSLVRLFPKKRKSEKKRRAVLVALQSTLQNPTRHAKSYQFFKSDFKMWQRDLDGKFDIEWHFIWIVPKSEAMKSRIVEKMYYGVQVTVHRFPFERFCQSLWI